MAEALVYNHFVSRLGLRDFFRCSESGTIGGNAVAEWLVLLTKPKILVRADISRQEGLEIRFRIQKV